MEAAEKAKELYSKYMDEIIEADSYFVESGAKSCALIAVDEIIKEVPTETLDSYKGETYYQINERHSYWLEVKQEIKKL